LQQKHKFVLNFWPCSIFASAQQFPLAVRHCYLAFLSIVLIAPAFSHDANDNLSSYHYFIPTVMSWTLTHCYSMSGRNYHEMKPITVCQPRVAGFCAVW